MNNKEFEPSFLNALARKTPEPYLDAQARVVEEMNDPLNWRGRQISALTTWKILFKYLQRQSTEALKSGSFDRYLDAIEKYGNSSSSEPRDVYAFYILRGMNERAKRFRERANRAATYDLDYYFKQVDSRRAGEPVVRQRRAYRSVLAEPPSALAGVADRHRPSSDGAAIQEVADPRPRMVTQGQAY